MITTAEHEKASASDLRSLSKVAAKELADTLEKHTLWLGSTGEMGEQADLSKKNLTGADLVDTKLQNAVLNKTILKSADLTLADLRDASLLQANLEGANVLGTQFQQADLQAADLRGATGLLSAQLAGTNLFGALLPETTQPFDSLKLAREAARKAGLFLGLSLLLEALVWLRIFTTTDVQMVKDSSAVPFSSLQTTLPVVPVYLFAPVLILVLYVCFHVSLQRLWEAIAQLPAIFPDGRKLDACLPWFARWPARKRFHWLRVTQSPLAFLEAAISRFLFYWITPITVLLIWGRYLTLQDLRGTMLHVAMVMGAVAAAMNFPRMALKSFVAGSSQIASPSKFSTGRISLLMWSAPVLVGVMLLLLSVGTYLGIPHEVRPGESLASSGLRAWAPEILWTIGYNPFAQLTEVDVSTKPSSWSGRDDDVSYVRGANLNGLRLRYIQGYRSFLAKARFWRTDLRGAYLSEADLREANLRQADLQYAILDHARLNRATLREAQLRDVNLDRADLRDANMSFTSLPEASLLDATLDGANIYKSDLHSASMQRASLMNADLREANLEGANLMVASLGRSYLVSTNLRNTNLRSADLTEAILTEASLRKADLSGAKLQGAILGGADITGANLQGADLRNAGGLTPLQLCSAANLHDTQIDPSLLPGVSALCGSIR